MENPRCLSVEPNELSPSRCQPKAAILRHSSHVRIIRPASAFRRDPFNVFGGVLDVASFAMDAILRVDDKARVCATGLARVNDLVDAGWAIKPRGLSKPRKIVTDRNVGIVQAEMNRLILFMIRVGEIDRRGSVKG